MAYDEILIGNNFPEIQERQPITCFASLSLTQEEEDGGKLREGRRGSGGERRVSEVRWGEMAGV